MREGTLFEEIYTAINKTESLGHFMDRLVTGAFNCGYVPLSHLGNLIIIRTETTIFRSFQC